MASDQHLQLFSTPLESPSTSSFPQFSRLPQELRLYVWKLTLHHGRFLRLYLRDTGPCSLITKQQQHPVNLLHVSVEARQAAKDFYRVHLPCRYEFGGIISEGTGWIFINPEWDILWIHRLYPSRDSRELIQLLQDIKSNDPRDVGIQNLALTHNDIHRLADTCSPRHNIQQRQTLRDALEGIRTMYYITLENAGRPYLGPFNAIPTRTDYQSHRSRPTVAFASFDRLPSDPRPIPGDFNNAYVGTYDPRKMMHQWQKVLKKWKIEYKHDVSHRFMLSTMNP